MRKFLHVMVSVLALVVAVPQGAGELELLPSAHAASCAARENFSEKAVSFIGGCRKASINGEFPSEMLGKTLGEIQRGSSASHKKAWKLLNDGRFAR